MQTMTFMHPNWGETPAKSYNFIAAQIEAR
jgi:hypothetical protein